MKDLLRYTWVRSLRTHLRWVQVLLSLVLGARLSQATLLYTFSNTGGSPYSFSFLEPEPLTGVGAFAIPPFQVGGLTFSQATFLETGGTECLQFGTPGATLTATSFSCGAAATAPDAPGRVCF